MDGKTNTRSFTQDAREGIIHVDVMIGLANFHCYVDRRVFLERVEAWKGSSEDEQEVDEPERILWEDWGPKRTRMMASDIRMQRQWLVDFYSFL
jgi:hypothetical protein